MSVVMFGEHSPSFSSTVIASRCPYLQGKNDVVTQRNNMAPSYATSFTSVGFRWFSILYSEQAKAMLQKAISLPGGLVYSSYIDPLLQSQLLSGNKLLVCIHIKQKSQFSLIIPAT